MTGFLLLLVHALIGFVLFKVNVFSRFLEADGTLTLIASLSMLSGILAFVFFMVGYVINLLGRK